MVDLSGRVALITGASGGIGAVLARRFAAAGAAVIAHSHRTSAAALVDELTQQGAPARHLRADLTQQQQVDELIDTALGWHGHLDIVVNNHGNQDLAALDELSLDDWHAMLAATLTSVVATTQAAAQVMTTGSAITQIASIEAAMPDANAMHAHYGTAKAGVVRYTASAAAAYGPRGIRVNAVSPGLIHRPGLDEQWPAGVDSYRHTAPLGRLGNGDDVAQAALFLSSPLAAWITGQTLTVDGGMSTRPAWGG